MIKLKILIGVIGFSFILGITFAALNPIVCSIQVAFKYKAQNDVEKLAQIADLYRQDHGSFPVELDDLIGEYLERKVKAPWGEDYEYISNGDNAIIFSYGDPKESNLIYYVQNSKI